MPNHEVSSPYSLVVQPDDGIAPVIQLIQSAKIKLRIKQFTLTDPRILREIIEAHDRKVDVQVLLNPHRPDMTRDNDETFSVLEKHGIAVQWSNPKFAVTHEKSILADSLTALIATFNCAPKYFGETRDYGIITRDLEQVADIANCFKADWERTAFVPDETGLVWSDENSRYKMAQHIDGAEVSLDVQHPKFCDLAILDRLMEAHARGIKVRILCSGTHGVRAWDRVETFSSLRMMQKFKVPVRRMKHPKLHAKLIIADSKIVFTGSMNIHHRAFDERRELGIVLDEKPIVKRLIQIYEEDWESSAKFEVPDPLLTDLHEEHGEVGD